MDKEALEGIPDSERRRQEVEHFDLSFCMTSNRILGYIRTSDDGECVCTGFTAYRRSRPAFAPLIVLSSPHQTFYAGLMSMLDPKAITVIFANVEDILLTNTVCKWVTLIDLPLRSKHKI